jgi:hypothetical protein
MLPLTMSQKLEADIRLANSVGMKPLPEDVQQLLAEIDALRRQLPTSQRVGAPDQERLARIESYRTQAGVIRVHLGLRAKHCEKGRVTNETLRDVRFMAAMALNDGEAIVEVPAGSVLQMVRELKELRRK